MHIHDAYDMLRRVREDSERMRNNLAFLESQLMKFADTQYESENNAIGIDYRHRHTIQRPRNTRLFETKLDRGSGFLTVIVEYTLEENHTMVCVWGGWYDIMVLPYNEGGQGAIDVDSGDINFCQSEIDRIEAEISAKPSTWEIDYD